ncbi:MAG: TIR domain-containing protein [Chloroflexi bacterium]|nr:TIR domain-containing protein [Chloroflexota bacterium]
MSVPHVFISYARPDAQYAERLTSDLRSAGFMVWRDTRTLNAYQDFTDEIEGAISDARHVLVCLTPHIQRGDTFVRREIAYALQEEKPIIPLIFPGGELPSLLSTHSTIDMSRNYETGFTDLVMRLNQQTFQFEQPTYADLPELVNYLNMLVARTSETIRRGATELLTVSFIERRDALGHPPDPDPLLFPSVGEAFRHYDGNLLLLGDPGLGKTTSLLDFARDAALDRLNAPDSPVPMLLNLDEWDPERGVVAWMQDAHPEIGEFIPDLIAAGRALLLFDKVSMLPSTEARLAFLDQINLLDANQMVVAWRRHDYENLRANYDIMVPVAGAVELRLLDIENRQRIITQYVQSQFEELVAPAQDAFDRSEFLEAVEKLAAYMYMQPWRIFATRASDMLKLSHLEEISVQEPLIAPGMITCMLDAGILEEDTGGLKFVSTFIRDAIAFDRLTDYLHSPSPELRYAATRGLGILQDRRAVPHLRRMFNEQTDSQLAFTIQAALEQLKPDHTIFISHRRRDWAFAYLYADHLRAHLDASVFLDRHGIDDPDFEASILRNLRKSALFLLVVTPNTFASDRIHLDNDWIRREITEAIELNLPIALALTDNLELPAPEYLPIGIRPITGKQGYPVQATSYEQDLVNLAEFIARVTPINLLD